MGFRTIIAFFITVALIVGGAPPALAEPLDFAIPHGHFFKQANGLGGAGDTGFAVVDDTAPFWSAFQRLGGIDVLGYPVSRRFAWDGFLVQAFQKAVLQWRPEVGQFYFVNVFDRVSEAGKDGWLEEVRSTPPSFDHSADRDLAWDDVVKRHQALLNVNPAIKARYFADPDPIQHFGLPMAYADYGSVFVVRAQRAVFQQWKVAVLWARAGDVVVANGGDVAKEAGIYPIVATVPHAPERSHIVSLLAGPERLYVLQKQWAPAQATDGSAPIRAELVTSGDLGQTWQPFAGGLPVASDCLGTIGMDYATRDTLYASTCQGLYRWMGVDWERISTLSTGKVAVTYGDPRRLMTTEGGRVILSTDGGAAWSDLGFPETAAIVGIDPRNPRNAYALSAVKGWWFSLWRGTGERNQWTRLPAPSGPTAIKASMTIDGATGHIYMVARDTASNVDKLWRTTNPDALDARAVHWELIHEFGQGLDVHLFSAGVGPCGVTLYATAGYRPGAGLPGGWFSDAGDDPVLIRSYDGGRTWTHPGAPEDPLARSCVFSRPDVH